MRHPAPRARRTREEENESARPSAGGAGGAMAGASAETAATRASLPSASAAMARQVQSMPHAHARATISADPSELTEFPMPGFFASTMQVTSLESPRAPPPPPQRTSRRSKFLAALQLVKDTTAVAADHVVSAVKSNRAPPLSASDYWMPDNLCKVCYDCGTTFSLFRRRHHCRLCGQIFCFDCANQYIDGAPHGFIGPIRICKFCDEYVRNDREKKIQASMSRSVADPRGEDAWPLTIETTTAPPSASPLLFSPLDVTAADCNAEDDSDNISGAATEPMTSEASLCTIKSSEAVDFSELNPAFARGPGRRPVMHRRRSSAELLETLESTGLLVEELQAENRSPGEGRRSSLLKETLSFRLQKEAQSQREAVTHDYRSLSNQRLEEVIQSAVGQVAKPLVTDGVDPRHLADELVHFVNAVMPNLLFSMNFRSPNGFNFAKLIKVKSIASTDSSPMKSRGSFRYKPHRALTEDCIQNGPYSVKWIAGAVCRRHLSHKSMARQLSNPRIMLFACGISFDRTFDTGKLSSLDTLMEQERSYISILVNKISALHPDIIFVERTVSRQAQEQLRDCGVAIAFNVKRDTLDRISRHTGAKVLTSVDHVDQEDATEVIGTCRSFRAETVRVCSEDDSPHRPHASNGPLSNSRPRTETYLYLDGCDPLTGCTIVITGPNKETLRTMKALLRNVVSIAYRLQLEAQVLPDLNDSISDGSYLNVLDGSDRVVWCTTSTLRVFDSAEGERRYHQCAGPKHVAINTYTEEDVSLGNFLSKEIEALTFKCRSNKCNYAMIDHMQSFSCCKGTMFVSFEYLPDRNAQHSLPASGDEQDNTMNLWNMLNDDELSTAREMEDADGCPLVVYWRCCTACKKLVSHLMPLQKSVYKYSFARLLEVLFSDHMTATRSHAAEQHCTHDFRKSQVLLFVVGDVMARFDFTPRPALRLLNTFNVAPRDDKRVIRSEKMNTAIRQQQATLTSLLADLVKSFSEKIEGILQVVEKFSAHDEAYTRLLVQVGSVRVIVIGDRERFTQKINQLDVYSPQGLEQADATKAALYHTVCQWIDEVLKLRKVIKQSLPMDAVNALSPCFQAGASRSYSTPVMQSPVISPRARQACSSPTASVAPMPSSSSVKNDTDDSFASKDCISINGPDPEALPVVVSASSNNDLVDLSSRTSTPPRSIDATDLGWKSMITDLVRVLGRPTSESDFDFQLPTELTSGHPSLPCRSEDHVMLVRENEPITCVAYALGSALYEEKLDSWKLAVHNESAASLAAETNTNGDSGVVATNWSRDALSSPVNNNFRHVIAESPRHVRLLKASSSSTESWEFATIAHYPLQFEVLRDLFFGDVSDFLVSISHVNTWAAVGGKSGASFYRTLDDRFVVKHISSTESQSFLEVLPAYFKYMARIYFEGAESVLSKIVGMYQTTVTRRDTGHKTVSNLVVMENAFFQRSISRTYDLKGSSRNRYAEVVEGKAHQVLLDGNFVEFTHGHPLGVLAEHHELLKRAISNDTEFLYSINIVDFSLIVGLETDKDEEDPEAFTQMTVGVIDYLRQFDLIKRVESVSKSVGMIAGQASPTIIEPGLYGKRFKDATSRYFMPVTPIDSGSNQVEVDSQSHL